MLHVRRTLLVCLASSLAVLAACGGNPPPEPAPSTADPDSIARERARQDSIARADSIRRAEEREREADSLCERARAATAAGNYENARELYERARREYAGTDCAERAGEELERLEAIQTIRERVHFEFDRSEITDEAAEVLRRKAEVLRNHRDLRITIEGHCDERGSNEYNMALGQRRAEAARAYLVDLGVPESMFETISYGEERPLVNRSTEAAWSQNRRSEFVIRNVEEL